MTDSMYELEQILREHALRYPLLQPTDAVKLVYQNTFGGGHLVSDAPACMESLRREYAALAKDPSAMLCEDIGNGIVRVHLAALPEEALAPLGDAFLRSAEAHTGSQEQFLCKLAVLERLTEEGIFSFGIDALRTYLARYAHSGYPAVSHSEIYRAHYRPAYRVVCKREIGHFSAFRP